MSDAEEYFLHPVQLLIFPGKTSDWRVFYISQSNFVAREKLVTGPGVKNCFISVLELLSDVESSL